jgi:hypothetical protein
MSKLTENEINEFRNLANVKHIVERSENPHPAIIVLIIVGSILIIYCIYVNIIKKSISGEWADENNNIHIIYHDKWKDTIIVDSDTFGIVKGNLVVIYVGKIMKMGILLNDNIDWIDGTSWYNIYGY